MVAVPVAVVADNVPRIIFSECRALSMNEKRFLPLHGGRKLAADVGLETSTHIDLDWFLAAMPIDD